MSDYRATLADPVLDAAPDLRVQQVVVDDQGFDGRTQQLQYAIRTGQPDSVSVRQGDPYEVVLTVEEETWATMWTAEWVGPQAVDWTTGWVPSENIYVSLRRVLDE